MAYSFGDFHSRAKLKEWLSSQALAGGLECVGFLQVLWGFMRSLIFS